MGTAITYTEQELVALLKNKDQNAFGYLYERYSGALYSSIVQIVDQQELANDVLQEVFVNIWRRIETYDAAKGRLYTWMLNIARNASIDLLRSKGFQNSKKNASIPENVDDGTLGTAFQPDANNIGLKKAVQQLKEEHRILIDLAYFKGYTHEEIAEITKTPLGTVKTRIRSALTQMRSLLS
ncbi:MAG: sigma-70 family RNA polymerase sigma factor [Chitinophagaceae bacterium]|uniref:RNA polymerase sigma factor n=1 Tax=unclassified Paraflavitalea TaxID=2798305 RepID=UPI003D32B9EE|nr:sigma-70 family RNA polymerase sigma factor [Chitinophagaceae bacterium]